MGTLINAQERSKDEFEALFQSASPKYRFIGVTRPAGCRMSIVEAVWDGEDFDGAIEAETSVVDQAEIATKVETPIESAYSGVEQTSVVTDAQVPNSAEAVAAN